MNRLLSTLKPGFIVYNARKLCYDAQQQIAFCQLQNRHLISLEGNDSQTLLQGLITNDMNLLSNQQDDENVSRSLYTIMLNAVGRVLFDTIIYSVDVTGETKQYLLECDRNLAPDMVKHLNTYKMRKKLKITMRDDLKLWAVFRAPRPLVTDAVNYVNTHGRDFYTVKLNQNHFTNRELFYKDPRIPDIGYRAILTSDISPKDVLQVKKLHEAAEDDYRVWRYQLGMGEGAIDHPPGKCLLYDGNVDYLNGINFHKGCYIGQEVAARSHYITLVRRRLLPLIFSEDFSNAKNTAHEVVDDSGKNMGKVLYRLNNFGVAVLKVHPCLVLNAKMHVVINANEKCSVFTYKPFWWPKDAQLIP